MYVYGACGQHLGKKSNLAPFMPLSIKLYFLARCWGGGMIFLLHPFANKCLKIWVTFNLLCQFWKKSNLLLLLLVIVALLGKLGCIFALLCSIFNL